MKPDMKNFACVACLALLMAGCGEEETGPVEEVIRPVLAMKVGDATEFVGRSFPGRAKAVQEVDLSFRVSGPLITRSADVGDEAQEGEVLARIDPRDFEVRRSNVEAQLESERANLESMRKARPEKIRQTEAAVEKAEAALKLAVADFDRINSIKEEDPGAVSQALVDRTTEKKERAEAELRRAKEDLRIAQIGARAEDIAAKEAAIRSLEAAADAAGDYLGYTYLRAPFAGTIVATYVENFEDVRPKQPILRLLDTSQVEMIVNIPESLISTVPYVEEVTVTFDALPGREIPAVIKEVGSEASETTRTYPVTLIMDQPDDFTILPGMAGRARGRPSAEMQAERGGVGLEVPVSAVFSPETEDGSFVWVIDENALTVSLRKVSTGEITERGILVRDGLETGEWIATAGVHYLREGQKVRIRETGQEG